MHIMVTYILLGLAALVALLLIAGLALVALQPAEFRISRRKAMAAAPSAIFPHVNELAKWRAWSPWEKLDPNLKRSYEGPPGGEGASYSWVGNDKVGEGRMTIVESKPTNLVRIRLEFIKPFQATNTSEFTLEPSGSGTDVTWSMTGRNGFVNKVVCLVMNMDKLVGKDFEQGLNDLKAIVEAKG
jgi:hypothetical protein